jgi:hypothetical protein
MRIFESSTGMHVISEEFYQFKYGIKSEKLETMWWRCATLFLNQFFLCAFVIDT